MSRVLNRTTLELLRGVDPGLYDPGAWIIDPDLPPPPRRYWKISGDLVLAMDAGERAAVDAANEAAAIASAKTEAAGYLSESAGPGLQTRAIVGSLNKRINYLTTRVEELQTALDAVKRSNGPADNIRAAIPASWLGTSTRGRGAALTSYQDEITSGDAEKPPAED